MRNSIARFWRSTFPPSIQAFAARCDNIDAQIETMKAMLVSDKSLELGQTSADQNDVIETLRHLRPHRAVGFDKKRFGSAGDGGYIMLDDLRGISRGLSFGIDVNDDWDLELAKAGVPVDQYDHSVVEAPSTHEHLRFFRKKVGIEQQEGAVTIGSLLKEIEGPLILKMDIEGHEWDVLDAASASDLSRFTQICVEFHGLSLLADKLYLPKLRSVFEKITRSHKVVHVHANNCSPIANVVNLALPNVLEVSFASVRQYELEPTIELFPGPLDAANSSEKPDIQLGHFMF